MHHDQSHRTSPARRLVVDEIQFHQTAQGTADGALVRPRRAQVDQLVQPHPVISDLRPLPRQHRDDRVQYLADRPADPGLTASLGHAQGHAVRGVEINTLPRLSRCGRAGGSCFCITIFVTRVRALLCCVQA